MPSSIPRNRQFCSFVSFLIVSLTPNNISESSRDLTIFKISSFSSFEIIEFILRSNPKIHLCIPASAADTVAVNPRDRIILDN